MNKQRVVKYVMAANMLAAVAACGDHGGANAGAKQTGFPGQVTAGGGTSGEVMARSAQKKTDGTYAGGTPGIAGGSGGNTSGAATGGSVQESGRGPSHGVNTPQGAQASGTQAAGTPGIPGGSGGNTGGAATGGSMPQVDQGKAQGSTSSSSASQSSTSVTNASSTTSSTRR
jgi:hypothetical protein